MADANEINQHIALICPELKSPYAQFPMRYESWLNPHGDAPEGKPVYMASKDVGLKENYVFCSVGLKGPGYYHVLTKIAYVNLYNRVGNKRPSKKKFDESVRPIVKDAWDTTKRIVWNRSRSARPDDAAAYEAGLTHMTQVKLNPAHGLKF